MNFESRASHSPEIPFTQVETYTGTGNEHAAFPVLYYAGHAQTYFIKCQYVFSLPGF